MNVGERPEVDLKHPLFKDVRLQQVFDDLGYVKFEALDEAVVREIKAYYDQMNLLDTLGAGYKVALYSADLETKRKCREFLYQRAFPHLQSFFVDRWPYVCSYLVKQPNGTIITAHQDWSYCDESKYDPVTCWIPLCDVNEDNAALGFINGSHKYFDYLRGFPYMVADTPVYRHTQKITPYLNLIRMKAGEAVVFNDKIIHGSFSNYTGQERAAVAFILQPTNEPLFSYYLKPNAGGNTLLKYNATPDFYLEYNNPRLYTLYQQGKTIDGHDAQEVPYRFERIEWGALEQKLASTGNHRDPWKVAKVEDYFRVKLYA